MVVNVYLNEGKVVASHVDEVTKHRHGDAIVLNDERYVVTNIQEMDHIDYQTVVRVNELVSKPPEIDAD